MTSWVRFRHQDTIGFGALSGGDIAVHEGDMLGANKPSGQRLALSSVQLLAPVQPSKIVALWNNFHALAAKLNTPEPLEPLYFLKAPSSVTDPGATVNRPASYDGKVVYEGELAIVIGKTCSNVSVADAGKFVFGYTCVNDITAADIINKDATFAQWSRAKSYDRFGPLGPAIVSGLDPSSLVVKTILNGAERQSYPVSDMIFSPLEIVSKVSRDMTLQPGDLICCGTSVGVGVMKEAVNTVTIAIDGIGELTNEYRN